LFGTKGEEKRERKTSKQAENERAGSGLAEMRSADLLTTHFLREAEIGTLEPNYARS
jgi:hypothetical protein